MIKFLILLMVLIPSNLLAFNRIDVWASYHRIDPNLVRAIVQVESGGRPNAVGDDGKSFGLMQVQKIHAKKANLKDPDVNLMVGAGYLKKVIRKHGVVKGVQAYNIGETQLSKGKRSMPYLKKVGEKFLRLTQKKGDQDGASLLVPASEIFGGSRKGFYCLASIDPNRRPRKLSATVGERVN